jgi:hypothetical protein
LHRRLRWRLRTFSAIAAALLTLVLIRVLQGVVHGPVAVLALAAGYAVGAALSRLYRLEWDEPAGVIIARFDRLGLVILAAYVAVLLLKGRLLAEWSTEADPVAAASLSFSTGIIVGRAVFTRGHLRRLARALGLRIEH